MAIDLPGDVAVDIRQPILGDSFSWDGIEPAAAKKQIVIHATASDGPGEDGFTMAEYHVNHNGWGGIGVHFVCTKDSYPGRSGVTPGGAHIQYVGDLLTMRAGVADNNQGKVHIEISGLFTNGHGVPSEAQLRAVRQLIDFLLAPNNLLPSLNYHSQVTYHNAVALPGGGTSCPGWDNPQFGEWFGYLQGGPEPSWWSSPQPQPAPTPEPTPIPVAVETPAPPVDNRPEWERTWDTTPVAPKVVAVPSADVFSFPQNKVLKTLPGNELVKDIAGSFTVNGQLYYQTVYSASKNLFNGILASELKDYVEPPKNPAPNPGGVIDGVQPPVVPTNPLDDPAFEDPFESPDAPLPAAEPQVNLLAALKALGEWLLGILSSPLRLVGLINKLIKR